MEILLNDYERLSNGVNSRRDLACIGEVQMDPRNLFADEWLMGMCAYCGTGPDTRDHVPSRVFLDKPFPAQLPVVPACETCNAGFSLDEQYVACFIDAVLSGTADPSGMRRTKIRRTMGQNTSLASRIKRSQEKDREGNLIWKPERDRVRRIVLKLARGHAAYELYPKLEEAEEIAFAPLLVMSDDEVAEFENTGGGNIQGWPEIGSRAFFRACGTSPDGYKQMGGWVVVQPGRYRYAVNQGLFEVRIVLSEYLGCRIVWA